MRSLRFFASVIGSIFWSALAQTMAERAALVEHKALAAPAAFGFRHALQISQNAALEMIDLGKTARLEIRTGLFAADAAGAEHRDLLVLLRIEGGRHKIL